VFRYIFAFLNCQLLLTKIGFFVDGNRNIYTNRFGSDDFAGDKDPLERRCGSLRNVQDYYEIDRALGERFRTNVIADDKLYDIIRELTGTAYPTMRNGDTRWFYFYVPVKRNRKTIALPFSVVLYRGRFFVLFEHTGQLEVRKEEDRGEIYGRKIEEAREKKLFGKLLKDALSFVPKIKRNPEILEKLVPYDLREGRVKRKYIDGGLMHPSEAERIKRRCTAHKRRMGQTTKCSLGEYLNTASICYKAAFPDEVKNMTPKEMYLKLADGRHGGMLEIKDQDSPEEFEAWRRSGKWAGSHPFEIVFSWIDHGILLYPPSEERPHYTLRVVNLSYAGTYVKMAEGLMTSNVPFLAPDLKNALDYLTGEIYLGVNSYEHGTLPVFISTKRERGFKHVEWEHLKVVKFRK